MKKPIVITKHIHSCFASSSSMDEFLVIVTDTKEIDFKIELNSIIVSKKFPGLNGETIAEIYGDSKYVGFYLEADKTFYNKGLHSNKIFGRDAEFQSTSEFISLVKSYYDKGFKKDRNIPAQKAFWEREKIKSQKEAKKQKLVLWMDLDILTANPKLYQGGFSDEVFNSPKLKEYVSKGYAHGWIGHSSGRTAVNDKQIEAGLRKRGIPSHRMFNWISSSDGRHFGDSLEGSTKKEQKISIENYLNGIYNCCILYGASFHEGTMSSTHKLEILFGGFGILLPIGGKYNSKEHLKKLIVAKQKLSGKETLTKEEEYIEEIINEVFANKLSKVVTPLI